MSDLRQAAEEYLAIRRALGFKFVLQGRLLLQFVGYLEETGASCLTTDLAVAWAKAPADADPAWWGQRLSVIRGFARHLHAIDETCEVPPADVLPAHFRRAVPYLYSEDEIERLIGAAGALLPPLRGETYATLIGLLAVSGMRIWFASDSTPQIRGLIRPHLAGSWARRGGAGNERARSTERGPSSQAVSVAVAEV